MIYSINNVSFESFLYDYTSLIMPNDIVILSSGIVPPISKLASTQSNSLLMQLSQLSLDKKCIVIIHTQMTSDYLPYNTVMTIDNGKLSSTSSEIFCTEKYAAGGSVNFLESSQGLVATIIGDDLFYTELWRIYKIARPVLCFYFSTTASSPKHFAMLKAFSLSCGRSVVCTFSNLSCIVSCDVKIKDIEFGNLRVMLAPKKIYKPKLVDKQVYIRKEFS